MTLDELIEKLLVLKFAGKGDLQVRVFTPYSPKPIELSFYPNDAIYMNEGKGYIRIEYNYDS